MNDPNRVHRAEYKPYQLVRAAAVGLSVPATMVTNDPAAVAGFAADRPHGIVTKALYARMPRTSDGQVCGVVYTHRAGRALPIRGPERGRHGTPLPGTPAQDL